MPTKGRKPKPKPTGNRWFVYLLRCADWLQFEVTEYNRTLKEKPGYRKFTAHNFRDTAMTRAWDA